VLASALLGGLLSRVAAQTPPPRSGDYLFASTADDARALWVNPAGLARPIASLFGEFSSVRAADDGWRLGQYSFALSSRSAAIGYQRDRFENQPSLGTWRVGGAIALTKMSLGTTIVLRSGGRSWDAGILYTPLPKLAVGLVVRNIGRPVVRDSAQRLVAVGGVTLRPARGTAFTAEVLATERRPATGYDKRYRAGAQIVLPARWPITVTSAFEFDSRASGTRLARWSIGLALGRMNQLVGVATAVEPEGAARSLASYSVAAVAKGVTRQGGPAGPL